MKFLNKALVLAAVLAVGADAYAEVKTFPDGSAVPEWFNDAKAPKLKDLDRQYKMWRFFRVGTNTSLPHVYFGEQLLLTHLSQSRIR